MSEDEIMLGDDPPSPLHGPPVGWQSRSCARNRRYGIEELAPDRDRCASTSAALLFANMGRDLSTQRRRAG